jgi:proteic killer suppression protein
MIRSFADKRTESIWQERPDRKLRPIARAALRKLIQLNAAEQLDDLKMPPGNRLEALKGRRNEQYSIRINRQWRICFEWKNGAPQQVEITDYHA